MTTSAAPAPSPPELPPVKPRGYIVTYNLEAGPKYGRRAEFYERRNDADFHCRKTADRDSRIEPVFASPVAENAHTRKEKQRPTNFTIPPFHDAGGGGSDR